jgi:hypothetical protein
MKTYNLRFWKNDLVKSTLDNPELLLSGHLLFEQNFYTIKFFIIPSHVSVKRLIFEKPQIQVVRTHERKISQRQLLYIIV